MDHPTPVGIAMTSRARPFRVRDWVILLVVVGALQLAAPRMVHGEERFALIVSGAAGGQDYAEQYRRWTSGLSTLLVDHLKLSRPSVIALQDEVEGPERATADNVRRAINGFRRKMATDDLLLVVLIGHGTFDGADAKFNLVGPDLESAEWAALLRGLPGRLVLINTTSASFPFLERLAGPRRIVVTATDSVAQRFDTVFPEYFLNAFQSDASDIDKNGRVSVWEAFIATAGGVRRHYQQRGQLATERPLLDDNGDGIGREAGGSGQDGAASSRTYLDVPGPGAAATDEVLLKLLQQRTMLEAEVEELKIRRTFITAEEYTKEFERLMIELARVSRDVRQRRGT
jgi:hypothetical protein